MATLYEKRGRSYKPVANDRALNGLPNGNWLVVVEEGRTRIRRLVKPAHAEWAAAAMVAEEAMLTAMCERAEWRAGQEASISMGDKERRAWAAWRKIMGYDADAHVILSRGSAHDIATAGIAAVRLSAAKKEGGNEFGKHYSTGRKTKWHGEEP